MVSSVKDRKNVAQELELEENPPCPVAMSPPFPSREEGHTGLPLHLCLELPGIYSAPSGCPLSAFSPWDLLLAASRQCQHQLHLSLSGGQRPELKHQTFPRGSHHLSPRQSFRSLSYLEERSLRAHKSATVRSFLCPTLLSQWIMGC